MPMSNKGLTKVMEECSELITVAAKRIAFPNDDIHPDGTHQKTRMQEEIGDALASIEFVIDKNNLDREAINAREVDKLNTYYRWDAQEDEQAHPPRRRVVAAALRAPDGELLVGIRHYSQDMHDAIARAQTDKFNHCIDEDQGFVDQFGVYMTRSEAYAVALVAGQIIRPWACTGMELYSEGLY